MIGNMKKQRPTYEIPVTDWRILGSGGRVKCRKREGRQGDSEGRFDFIRPRYSLKRSHFRLAWRNETSKTSGRRRGRRRNDEEIPEV
jgi:hypothetical protein